MKEILVPTQFFTLTDGSRVLGMRESYLRLLSRLSLTPRIISSFFDPTQLESMVANTSGVLFMGGSDVDPNFYGDTPHPETKVNEPERDDLELAIAMIALELKKPILGICRGCQLLAVAGGGKLSQHVPDLVENEIHSVKTYNDLSSSPRHEISVDEQSRLFAILGKSNGLVNSAHHQSIADPGSSFRVVARSSAGICEAIEHIDNSYFCFGVQNHPEMEGESGFFEPLLKEFAKAARG